MPESDGAPGPRPTDGIEADVRGLVERGELDAAATRAIAHYGPEIYGFLRAVARDDDLASEAFALGSEQLWRNLARFRWEASLRTWAYQLFRHALYQVRADPRRRPDRNLPLSILDSIAEARRSATAPFQRTEVKQGLRALRESLDPLDHELLVLRLDRAMSWKDIARALAEPGDAETTVDQRAAAYRKRFERAKAQLRELAAKHGLIPEE
ncbi:MAG TPA: sigma-70 family RNA polymerase sigma factor [Kofleriaceae bacterium]|nr:sigma-70 family RNA polymerase sigma factor [Kofleriaceae bacterium]